MEETRKLSTCIEWRLPVPRQEAWELLSNTSRLNRAVRIPKMHFEEADGGRRGTGNYFGRDFVWEEPPWEWIAPELFVCRKRFESSAIERMVAVNLLLDDGENASRGVLYYGWVPTGLFGGFVTRRVVAYQKRNMKGFFPELTRSLQRGTLTPLIKARPIPGGSERAAEVRSLLEPEFGTDLTGRLLNHVFEGDPIELDRLRPFALATRWKADRQDVLRMFLEGTRIGMFSARWDVMCPHCRGVRQTLERLDDLESSASCEACAVIFETGASALELAFRVHPSIRHVEQRLYCAAEPATKPHILMQLTNSTDRTVPAPAATGTYVVRSADNRQRHALEVRTEGPAAARLDGDTVVAPGGALTFPPTDRAWVVETGGIDQDSVRPTHVLSLEAYRAVMGPEVLATELSLELGVQTLLFTDVVGSTALYERLGDRAAFDAIRRHFDAIRAHVRAEGGTLIKTIGDAVMAAFSTPEAAARAAKTIATTDLGGIEVRLSMHSGTCIAVNLDTGIDYFGSVVNEAAKLQGAAHAGTVAMRPELAHRLGLMGEETHYRAGGVDKPAVLWRPVSSETPAGVRRRAPLLRNER